MREVAFCGNVPGVIKVLLGVVEQAMMVGRNVVENPAAKSCFMAATDFEYLCTAVCEFIHKSRRSSG